MSDHLRAGAAQGIITQPIGAEMGGSYCGPSRKVHSHIYASVLVLEQEERRACIVTIDAIGISPSSVQAIRARLSDELGFLPSSVLISGTHTHAGPATIFLRHWGKVEEHYLRYMEASIVGLVCLALDRIEEAMIGYDSALMEGLSVNRRIEGGPIDPELAVVRVDRVDARGDGQILAILANFGCHPITLHSHESAISADFPGYARQVVERVEPSKPVFLYTNGGGGDVNPVEYVSRQTSVEISRSMGTILGCEIVQTAERISTGQQTCLLAATTTVEIPLASLPSEAVLERTYAEARQEEQKYLADPALNRHWNELDNLEERRRYCELVRARILRDWATDAIQARRVGPPQTVRQVELQVLRLGEILLVGLPFEVFAQTALAIKIASWAPHTMVVSGANGLYGYLPPKDTFAVPGDYTTTGLAHKAYGIYGYVSEVEEIVRHAAVALVDSLR